MAGKMLLVKHLNSVSLLQDEASAAADAQAPAPPKRSKPRRSMHVDLQHPNLTAKERKELKVMLELLCCS